MKTLWFQLLLWFGITFIVVSGTFLFLINLENKVAPAARTSVQASSSQPVTDTVQPVEESPTKSSRSTVRLQSAYGLAMLLAFAIVAFILAKKMLAPLRSLNAQLDLITPRTLARKVWVQGDMTELQLLVEQINALLARMHIALMNLQQFSSQVAHDNRTLHSLLNPRNDGWIGTTAKRVFWLVDRNAPELHNPDANHQGLVYTEVSHLALKRDYSRSDPRT